MVGAIKRKNDEFYTSKEHVKIIFEHYLKEYDFKDKTIYLPCDSEESEFVKYLKENRLKLGYKELIYTSDDFNTHLDLFNKADIVITNPPFSKLVTEFIPLLKSSKVEFFIFGCLYNIKRYWCNINNIPSYKIIRSEVKPDIECRYITENGCNGGVNTCYLTNIKNVYTVKRTILNKRLSDYKSIVYIVNKNTGEKLPYFTHIKDVPVDINGDFFVSGSIFEDCNIRYFDIVSTNNNGWIFDNGSPALFKIRVKLKEKVSIV